MQGTSPFAFQSPSFHSASYLPKLEANFMRDFTCCDLKLPTLHDLLQHYEETHSDQVPPSLQKQNSNHTVAQPDAKAARAAVAASNIQMQGGAQPKPPQIDTSRQGQTTPQRSPTPVTPRQPTAAQQVTRGFAQPPQSQDEEPAGDMEMDMDYPEMSTNMQQPQHPVPNQARITQRSQFGQLSASQIASLYMPLKMGGLRNSQPTSPVSAGRNGNMYHNNPTVSSVNTPTLSTYNSTHPLQQQQSTPGSSAPGTPAELDGEFVGDLGNLNMGGMQFQREPYYGYPYYGNGPPPGHDMLDLCIDEPAKRLFSLNGAQNSDHNQSQQPAATSSASQLGDGQYSENSEIARNIREAQKRAGVPEPPADNGVPKPFHCPVIGCEKAYKNQNGLKYHKNVSCFILPCPHQSLY